MDELRNILDAGNGQIAALEEARLHEDAGLVPIDALGGDLVAAERDDDDDRDLDALAGGRDAGQQPGNGRVVRELEEDLVAEAVAADGPRQRDDLDVGRDARHEGLGVEVLDRAEPMRPAPAAAAGRGHVVHVPVVDHGLQRLRNVLPLELRRHVMLPHLHHLPLRRAPILLLRHDFSLSPSLDRSASMGDGGFLSSADQVPLFYAGPRAV